MVAKSKPRGKSRTVRKPFAVDDYIGALIKSINDDAAKARTAGLAMLLTGLYLVGTVIATTDEAMLLGTSRELPQLGIALPVVISYALAPPIFLFLHISTLILFERVGEKLAHYDEQIDARAHHDDRVHYDALLTTTNFVQTYFHKRNGRQTGWITRAMSWFSVTFFPLLILLAVQVDFIRYQHEIITLVHQGAIALDVAVLGWFYWRIRDGSAGGRATPNDLPSSPMIKQLRLRLKRLFERSKSIPGRSIKLVWRTFKSPGYWVPALFALWIGLGHAIVPEDGTKDEKTVGREPSMKITISYKTNGTFSGVLRYIRGGTNLLDSVICPAIDRGCRYLRLAHRDNLFIVTDRAKVVAGVEDWLSSGPATSQALAPKLSKKDPFRQVKGLDLRGRILRFADFTNSKLYKVILIGTNLHGAEFSGAWLPKSNLLFARLQGANLRSARLQGANLIFAKLQGADLREARLQGADLSLARLQGADLREARLQGADLNSAQLQGADLREARLQGAILYQAHLQGANLSNALLQGAELSKALLQGANLRGARLQGAQLRYAIIRGAQFAPLTTERGLVFVNLGYADLRNIQRGRIEEVDIALLKRNLARNLADIKLQQRILARVEKRRGQKDELEKARTKGAYCFNDGLRPQLKGCVKYASENAYFMTVIAEIFRPMVCDSAVEPAVARSFTDLAIFVPGFKTFRPNRLVMAEMLLDEKCVGRKHLSKQTITFLKDLVKRYKLKTPSDKK